MNKLLKLSLGILISVLGLYLAFHRMDFDALLENIRRVNFGLVLAASGLMVFSVWVRALRWKQLLNRQEFRLHHLFASAMIGYFGNSVLPFRLGEALRAYDITTKEQLSFSESIGTLILERFLDLIGLALVIGLFTMAYPSGVLLNRGALLLILGVLAVFVLGIWLPQPLRKIQALLHRWEPPSAFQQKINRFLRGLVDGIDSLRGNPHGIGLTFHTIFLWAIYYCSLYLITLGIGIHLSWDQIGVLLISTTFSIMIPAAPGYVGTYHAVAVLVLNSMFKIPLAESQAVAIILHAIGTLPYVVIGAGYFFSSSIKISDLKSGNSA